MSQENVEIVRRAFEAWNAGDMDAFVSCTTPTSIMRIPRGLAGARASTWVGRRSCASSSSSRETWDADALEADQRLHRCRRPSCREVHLAWRGLRPSRRTWR